IAEQIFHPRGLSVAAGRASRSMVELFDARSAATRGRQSEPVGARASGGGWKARPLRNLGGGMHRLRPRYMLHEKLVLRSGEGSETGGCADDAVGVGHPGA